MPTLTAVIDKKITGIVPKRSAIFFELCVFEHCDMQQFSQCTFSQCMFNECNFLSMYECEVNKSHLVDGSIHATKDSIIDDCVVDNTDLYISDGTMVSNCNLKNTTLECEAASWKMGFYRLECTRNRDPGKMCTVTGCDFVNSQ